MDIQVKIHITNGKVGQPVKVKKQLNQEIDKLVFAVTLFEMENDFRICGKRYHSERLKDGMRIAKEEKPPIVGCILDLGIRPGD